MSESATSRLRVGDMHLVRLDPGLPNGRWACVRALRGDDEHALAGGGGMAATELLDKLLVEVPGTRVGPGRAWELPVSDRDRLLAAVYAATFGDQIESEVPCESCEAYDAGTELSFSLAALVTSLAPDGEGRRELGVRSGPDDEGVFCLEDGTRFRLPTGADQRAVAGLELDRARVELLRRCVLPERGSTVADLSGEQLERVEAAMAYLCPSVEHEFTATCQECGAARTVRFDIQRYLMSALALERSFFLREVHYLASTYGWGLADILSLSRDDRRAYVELVVAERTARRERLRR